MIKSLLLFIFLAFFAGATPFSQPSKRNTDILDKLDSMRNSNSISKYFADLYYKSTLGIEQYISKTPDSVQKFIHSLENTFVDFFLIAAEADWLQQKIPEVWKPYFAGTRLSALQLKLIGVNAHVNGDIWQALCKQFTSDEIEAYRKNYIQARKSFKEMYDNLYQEANISTKRIYHLHQLTLGINKIYGWVMLKRWRNRQMRMAILFYKNKEKFSVLNGRVQKKMKRINNLIIRRLK